MSKGKSDKAEVALRRINRGVAGYEPHDDMRALEAIRKGEAAMVAESSWPSLLMFPTERRKMLFSCGTMFTQQINGILFFYSYGDVVAQSIGIKQAFTIAFITNTLQVMSVGVSVILGNRVPRWTNMWVSSTWVMWAGRVCRWGECRHRRFLVCYYRQFQLLSADLGPKVGFVYAGTTCVTLVYVWFCVGETRAGRIWRLRGSCGREYMCDDGKALYLDW